MSEYIKGKGAVGVAVSYYSLRGMVSIPLQPCEYNLIFDNGTDLFRVKVISCSYKTKYGVFSASIRTSGGNQPSSKVKKFNPLCCDLVFIVTSQLDMYELDPKEITATRQISLNLYSHCRIQLIPE